MKRCTFNLDFSLSLSFFPPEVNQAIKEERHGRGVTSLPIGHKSWIPTWLIKSEIKSHSADSLTQMILSLLIVPCVLY